MTIPTKMYCLIRSFQIRKRFLNYIMQSHKLIIQINLLSQQKELWKNVIKHGILKDILPKEKGVIEDMITVCYDEEIHKMREAEYNQELGEERGKEIGKLLQPETI